jgi:hypothetical protein
MGTSHGFMHFHSETWEGVSLPTSHFTESYSGQTFEVRHHQNNEMIFTSMIKVSSLPVFWVFLTQRKKGCQAFIQHLFTD